MMTDNTQALQAALEQQFDVDLGGYVTAEKLVAALAARVEQLIAANPDQLFSLLYRLDISEKKIKQALATGQDIAKKIAVLIYERQSEKIISRRQFKNPPPDADLAW
ncbi:MAG: hypothetical protein QM642_05255 [Edaphocola sp.]